MADETQSGNAATGQRFTERGAECRQTHVEGYTGPICSCPPMTCRATKDSSENEQFNPSPTAASNPQLRRDGRLRGETRRIPYVPPRRHWTDAQRIEALERITERYEAGTTTPADEAEAVAHMRALRRWR